MKRRKSIVSQAASISAWCAVFDWLSIVAALSVERHGPESSSAARRNTAQRSCQGVDDHSACASRAAAIARSTCEASPFATSASTWSRSCGMTASNVVPVSTRSPPITSGIEIRSPDISASRFWSSARSGEPGSYPRMGSLTAGGGRKIPGALIGAIVESVGNGRDAAPLCGGGLGRRRDHGARRRPRRARPAVAAAAPLPSRGGPPRGSEHP